MTSSNSKKAAEREGSRSEVREKTEEPMMNSLPGHHREPLILSERESLWKIMNREVIGSGLNSYGN